MKAYYNEIDPHCIEKLKHLIYSGLITDGDVDERSIEDVQPGDLVGYDRCHFFAGIAGWDYALNLAKWQGPCWTGSCPCQPWSIAGEQRKHDDPRHLWPHLFRLIRESKPDVIFGEQVSGTDGLEWLAGVHSDVESISYRLGAIDIPSASVGAAHVRPRLYWVADPCSEGLERHLRQRSGLRSIESTPSAERSNRSLPARIHERPTPASVRHANGVSRPVGDIKAFGNAIVPQLAAAFIRSYMECR